MGEPKPFASLSAGLLARKGGARPAMRRQPVTGAPANPTAASYDDLGWNDMGYDADPEETAEQPQSMDLKALMPGSMLAHNPEAEQAVEDAAAAQSALLPETVAAEIPEVVRQRESLADRVAAVASPGILARPTKKAAPRAVRAREKAAFTLRLDSARHLRLRLASAVTNRSAQVILTDLLDEYLATLPEIDAMASRLPEARPSAQR